MLDKVRQASLWAIPMGRLAQQKGASQRVRQVGGRLSAEYRDLDAQVNATAKKLGVALPSELSEQQQGWMTEISSKSGSELDRAFVQRLRAAHGQVLPMLAQVRSGTRNDLIRSFAATADVFVTRHQQYLETTKLVNSSALPESPILGSSTPPAAAATAATAEVYTVAMVYIAVPLAAGGLLWLLLTAGRRSRPFPYRPQPIPMPRSGSQLPSPPAIHVTGDLTARPRHAAAQHR